MGNKKGTGDYMISLKLKILIHLVFWALGVLVGLGLMKLIDCFK